jgi:hypothetical protein
MLEQTVALDGPVLRRRGGHMLEPAPIRADWILDGTPRRRAKLLAHGNTGGVALHMWDCSSGCFRWTHACEEIIYVLEGEALITRAGVRHALRMGDTHVFPAGSHSLWTVADYFLALACRSAIPVPTSRARSKRGQPPRS